MIGGLHKEVKNIGSFKKLCILRRNSSVRLTKDSPLFILAPSFQLLGTGVSELKFQEG